MMLLVVAAAALLLIFVSSVAAAASSPRPNILYIVGDDFGHADISYHGGDIPTPRMDELAAQGVKLESFYTQPVCAASRSSILTGRYVTRLGFQHHNPPLSFGGVGAIPLGEKLLPQYLADAGYSAHHVGKWHSGMIKKAYLPQNRGFETSFGYYEGAIDYYKHTVGPGRGIVDLHSAVAGGEQSCQPQFNGTYDLDMFVSRANAVVDAHTERKGPLFLYLALHSVHEPDECPAAFYAKFPKVPDDDHRRTMCGMTSAMDESFGVVVDHWRKAKTPAFWQNSFLVFHSDNGGPTYPGAGTNNFPLRGGKLTPFEGGIRVNAFVYSPTLIAKPGREEYGLMHITDLIPTFCGLAGAPPRGGRKLDGFDIYDAISSGAPSPRTEILHVLDPLGNAKPNFTVPESILGCGGSKDKPGRTTPYGACEESAALRVGDMKLIVGMFARCARDPMASNISQRMCGWWLPEGAPHNNRRLAEAAEAASLNQNISAAAAAAGAQDGPTGPPVLLYNISADPHEKHDLSAELPYKSTVEALLVKLRGYRESEWLDPQWDAVQNYASCDTGPAKSCKLQEIAYTLAAAEKGCTNAYIKG